ncbi:CPBP family intramembrane metalloprotease [Dyella terrae]|uniref:CPBP family intramembrane metalloprotease n=3 Tax=Rhodanobacteraceae TaxID=1775411 RepID=A0A4R0Z2M3_9GAMM|nr:CPBP family intramembrane metalloprotease [Dyella terrae]TCI13904.1 CPBP family intramembrane metalloprotease [Dyella soli]
MPQKLAAIPVPLWIVVTAQTLQSGVLCWLIGWLGLTAGARYGLDAPWLRAMVYRLPRPQRATSWWLAALTGVVAGVVIVAIDTRMLTTGHAAATPQIWRGALASFYGGSAEEIIFRLGVMSVMVWLLAAWRGHHVRAWMFVTGAVMAALLFGAGHLPAAIAAGLPLDAMGITRILALNGIVGVACGLLYWRRGLEHAMVAHFCADLVLHVAAPALT